jgi:hypothetical protein
MILNQKLITIIIEGIIEFFKHDKTHKEIKDTIVRSYRTDPVQVRSYQTHKEGIACKRGIQFQPSNTRHWFTHDEQLECYGHNFGDFCLKQLNLPKISLTYTNKIYVLSPNARYSHMITRACLILS